MPPPSIPSNWLSDVLKGLSDNELQEIVSQCSRTDGEAISKFSYCLLIIFKAWSRAIIESRK